MGQSTSSSTFRLGVSRFWPIRSSKLLGHKGACGHEDYFKFYYLSYFLTNALTSIVGSDELHMFLLQFIECRLHDFNKTTHLNIYLYAPHLKLFFRTFSQLFYFSNLKNKANFVTLVRFIYKRYLRQSFNSQLVSKKISKSDYLTLISFKRLFKFAINVLSANKFKKSNFFFFKAFFYKFFYNFFFFQISNFLKFEIRYYLQNFIPYLLASTRNDFKINFFFLKRFWLNSFVLARRICFHLLSRRSIGTIVRPFVFYGKKTVTGRFKRCSISNQASLEGFFFRNRVRHRFLKSFSVKNNKSIKKKKFGFSRFRDRQKQDCDRYFRASQNFICYSNNTRGRINRVAASSGFIRRRLSVAACVSSLFSKSKRRLKAFKMNKKMFKINRYSLSSRSLKKINTVRGLKIKACGRFSKRQMAEKFLCNIGSIKFSNPTKHVEFSYLQFALKNSTVGFKIWICFDINGIL